MKSLSSVSERPWMSCGAARSSHTASLSQWYARRALKRSIALGVWVAACLLVGSSLAGADDTIQDPAALKSLSLEELGAVEVTTVGKAPESLWNTPAAVYVLTQADIARSGVTSIPDALRLVPGVDVARIDTSRNWVVGIRGFGDQFSKSVLVLIDGRSAYTPLWAGVHWPIQDTLLEDVERIEVIRGPGGTIWGANAQNGVINIITKSSRETRGIYASVAAGNLDEAIGGVRVGGGRGNLHYRGYVKGTKRGPQYHTDGREFDTWAMGQAGFRLDWERPRDAVMISGDAYTAELGESVRVNTFAPPAAFLVDDPVDLDGFNLLTQWKRTLGPDSSFSIQGYVDHTYRLGTDFGERRTTWDVDGIHQWTISGRHAITWGAGARTSPSRIIQTYSFSDFIPHDHTFNLFSVFAQDVFTVVPRRLSVTAGVKFEHNTFSGKDVQPSARVLWTPSDRQSIWGGVTRGVRTPSRVDEDISVTFLVNPNPLTYGVLRGNTELEPEETVSLEAGYRTLLTPTLFIDATVFRNRHENIVDLGPISAGSATTDGVTYSALTLPWANAIDGGTRGFEVVPDWQINRQVRLRGSYSYLNVDLTPRQAGGLRFTLPVFAGAPRHHVTIQGLASLPGGIEFDPIYRYVSPRDGQGIGSYHSVDLRLAVPLRHGFSVSVAGRNLFDAHHPEWAREPGPTVEIRRSAYVRLTWRH
jgi:iron complex outermembrane receptor protein